MHRNRCLKMGKWETEVSKNSKDFLGKAKKGKGKGWGHENINFQGESGDIQLPLAIKHVPHNRILTFRP